MGVKNRSFNMRTMTSRILSANNDYLIRLALIRLSLYKWANLPDEIDQRFIEMCLLFDGVCAIVNDPEIGRFACQCSAAGAKYGVYENPTEVNCFNAIYHKIWPYDEIVFIRNNYFGFPDFPTIYRYAARIAEYDNIIDANIRTQKFPPLVLTSESRQLTDKNLFMQYEGNTPLILADNKIDPDRFKCLNIGAPYVADKIFDIKNNIWNEALRFIGANTVDFEKRERLIESEVQSNNEPINFIRDAGFITRSEAAEKYNQIMLREGEEPLEVETGVSEDVQLYGTTQVVNGSRFSDMGDE